MEFALAAAAAGTWSAYMASVNDGRSQHPVQIFKEGVRRIKELVEPPPPDPILTHPMPIPRNGY